MYNKKIEQNMEILGRMGEKYVAKWLRDQGHTVDESLFHFDSQKDMTCDDVTVEVKTHVPFVKAQAFGIKTQQLRKCRSVGRLFFINIPAPKHSFKWEGWLMEVKPSEFQYKIFTTSDGREMVQISMNQPAVTPIHKVDDSWLNEAIKYTRSRY